MTSEKIAVQCPNCSKTYQVGFDHLGDNARCACGNVFKLEVSLDNVPEFPEPPHQGRSAQELADEWNRLPAGVNVQPEADHLKGMQACDNDSIRRSSPYSQPSLFSTRNMIGVVALTLIIVFIGSLFVTGEASISDFTENAGLLAGMGGFFVLLCLVVAFNFIPAIVAFRRRAKNRWPIFVISFFFGWTVIGWIAAFIWAFNDEQEKIQQTT